MWRRRSGRWPGKVWDDRWLLWPAMGSAVTAGVLSALGATGVGGALVLLAVTLMAVFVVVVTVRAQQWGHRWTVALRGLESGDLSPALGFTSWRMRETAQAWCDAANAAAVASGRQPLTRWEVVPLERRRGTMDRTDWSMALPGISLGLGGLVAVHLDAPGWLCALLLCLSVGLFLLWGVTNVNWARNRAARAKLLAGTLEVAGDNTELAARAMSEFLAEEEAEEEAARRRRWGRR
jgi:hypothetical protein